MLHGRALCFEECPLCSQLGEQLLALLLERLLARALLLVDALALLLDFLSLVTQPHCLGVEGRCQLRGLRLDRGHAVRGRVYAHPYVSSRPRQRDLALGANCNLKFEEAGVTTPKLCSHQRARAVKQLNGIASAA